MEIGQDRTQPDELSCSLLRESLPDEYRLLSLAWEELPPSGLAMVSGRTINGVVGARGSAF